MKTKNFALAVVTMVLFSAFYFSSCSSDNVLDPSAASTVSKSQVTTLSLNDSLIADSLHHGKKPHCDSTFVKHPKPVLDSTFVRPPKPTKDSTCVRPPKPTHDSTFVKPPKPAKDSTYVKRPRPDSFTNDSVKPGRPNPNQPWGKPGKPGKPGKK